MWLLTGLWHGANWNFILWGLFYAVVLLIEKQFLGKYLAKLPKIIAWFLTFLVVNVGWLLFRVNNLSDLKYIISSWIHPSGSFVEFVSSNFSIMSGLMFMIIGLIFMFPVAKKMFKKVRNNFVGILIVDLVLIMMLVMGVLALVSSAYNPFIYFRF